MATIKNKTKKKTAQDWEKELKKLLKGETANTLKSAHISKLRAIRSAYYHIPASSRKNLSNRITTLSKQAEAIRKGTERAASNQVKKTKYKEAPQTKQRQEAKQTSDLRTKLGLPHIPEPKIVKPKEPTENEYDKLRKIMATISSERQKLNRFKNTETDVVDELHRLQLIQNPSDKTKAKIKDLEKELEDYRKLTPEEREQLIHDYYYKRIDYLHGVLKRSIDVLTNKYEDKLKILKEIADYRGVNVQVDIFKDSSSAYAKMTQQIRWLNKVYLYNADNNTNHTAVAKHQSEAIIEFLQKLFMSEFMDYPEDVKQNFYKLVDEIAYMTMLSIQYDNYVSSEGIGETYDIVAAETITLDELRNQPDTETYTEDEYYESEALKGFNF